MVSQGQKAVDDPDLRRAVLDLFQANRAYADVFEHRSAADVRALEAAQRRIDEARERVVQLQLGE